MLRRPNGYVLRALAEVPMVPAREVGAAVPAGTGPYTVARWDRGALLRLERRDDYWGPPPAIAAVEFAIVPDAAQALTLARRGEIDVVPALIPEHWPEQATAPGVVVAFAPMTLAPPRFVAVILNARRPPFDDRRVRRAAAMLVDRGRLAREGWRGLARPVAGPVWPGGLGDGAALPPPPYDPVRAMALLDEAGWKADKDGVRARGTDKLRITFLGVGAHVDPERDVIVTGLRRGGFGVEVRVVEPAAYLARLRGGDLDAAIVDYRGRVRRGSRAARGHRRRAQPRRPVVEADRRHLRGAAAGVGAGWPSRAGRSARRAARRRGAVHPAGRAHPARAGGPPRRRRRGERRLAVDPRSHPVAHHRRAVKSRPCAASAI